MLNELITKDRILFADSCKSWEDAIRLSGKPLLDSGCIEEGYIEACIDNVNKFGPYIVLAPMFAMPHAKAPEYVNRLSMSYIKIKEPVEVLNNTERAAKVFVMLAAKDNTSHTDALAALCEVMGDEEQLEQLINASSPEEVLTIINSK